LCKLQKRLIIAQTDAANAVAGKDRAKRQLLELEYKEKMSYQFQTIEQDPFAPIHQVTAAIEKENEVQEHEPGDE